MKEMESLTSEVQALLQKQGRRRGRCFGGRHDLDSLTVWHLRQQKPSSLIQGQYTLVQGRYTHVVIEPELGHRTGSITSADYCEDECTVLCCSVWAFSCDHRIRAAFGLQQHSHKGRVCAA